MVMAEMAAPLRFAPQPIQGRKPRERFQLCEHPDGGTRGADRATACDRGGQRQAGAITPRRGHASRCRTWCTRGPSAGHTCRRRDRFRGRNGRQSTPCRDRGKRSRLRCFPLVGGDGCGSVAGRMPYVRRRGPIRSRHRRLRPNGPPRSAHRDRGRGRAERTAGRPAPRAHRGRGSPGTRRIRPPATRRASRPVRRPDRGRRGCGDPALAKDRQHHAALVIGGTTGTRRSSRPRRPGCERRTAARSANARAACTRGRYNRVRQERVPAELDPRPCDGILAGPAHLPARRLQGRQRLRRLCRPAAHGRPRDRLDASSRASSADIVESRTAVPRRTAQSLRS